jgi:protein-S-isoprenylcysteine O-methyltransferase Ste14
VLKTLSLAGLLLMVAGLVGLLSLHALFAHTPAGITVQAAAVLLMIWARMTFGRRSFHASADPTEGGLVTTGPYRFIRHPIYTAACLFGCAGAVSNWSVPAGVLAVMMIVGAIVRMLCEERLVVARYPEYQEYARTTRRMVPFIF